MGTSISSQKTKNSDEVEGEEDAHDRALEQQEPRDVGLDPVLDVLLRREQPEREEHRGDRRS